MSASDGTAVGGAAPGGTLVRVCPHCGRSTEARRRICPMCFHRLDHVVPTVGRPSVRARSLLDPRALPGRLARAARYYPRAFALVVLAIAALLFVYVRYIRPPGPLAAGSGDLATMAASSAWPAADGDVGRTRSTAARPPLGGVVAWRRRLDTGIASQPLTDGETIYVALADARLIALSAADGTQRWSRLLPGLADAAPAIVDGRLYTLNRGGVVTAIDAASGGLLWTANLSEAAASSPVVDRGIVYALTFYHLVGLDAESGRVLWRLWLDAGFTRVTPAIAGERIAVATNNRFEIFDRRTGALRYYIGLRDLDYVAATADAIYTTTPRGQLVIDPDTTSPWWYPVRGAWANLYVWGLAPQIPSVPRRWSLGRQPGVLAAALGDGAVFTAAAAGGVEAHELSNGALRWLARTDPLAQGPVLTGAGLVAVERHGFSVLDPRSGDLRQRYPLADDVDVTWATFTDSLIVVTSRSGEVVIIR